MFLIKWKEIFALHQQYFTVSTTDAEALKQEKENTPSPRKAKLFKCEHHICPGLGIHTEKECFMCDVNLHSLCAAEAFREVSEADSDVINGNTICSVSCFRFSKVEGLTADIIKAEQAELLKRNKDSLKKAARELNVKVNCHVNGASRDDPKEQSWLDC